MSNAVASARKRRAGIMPEPPTPARGGFNPNNQMQQANSQQQSVQGGLTLQQVISLINTRLLKLEKYMNENTNVGSSESNVIENTGVSSQENADAVAAATNPILEQMIDEYNHRFTMFSEEIATLKDTIMKLQTFTMEVNKILYDERIQILSDIGDTKDTFSLNEPTYDNEYMISPSDNIESQVLTIDDSSPKVDAESESKKDV